MLDVRGWMLVGNPTSIQPLTSSICSFLLFPLPAFHYTSPLALMVLEVKG
jgi:hypothetical protein